MMAMFGGALIGIGAWLIVRSAMGTPVDGTSYSTLQSRFTPQWSAQHQRDLAVTRTNEQLFTIRLMRNGVLGLVSAVGVLILLPTLGIVIPAPIAVCVLVLLPLALVAQTKKSLREAAERARTSFSYALSSYLDLVNVLLAGGSGIETALVAAATTGDNWAFSMIRDTLERARAERTQPWQAFGDLAMNIGVTDLERVAGSMQLAGEQGARVRASLAAQADAVRGRQINEIEALAQGATERMGVPTVLLFVGFIALLGYPALDLVVGNM